MVSTEITKRFNSKLIVAINNFAVKYNIQSEAIRILLSPVKSNINSISLQYCLYANGAKLSDVTFSDVIKLDFIERAAIDEKKITEYIMGSMVKFAIGAGCYVTSLGVMIYLNAPSVQLALLNKTTNTYISYFTVDKLF